MKFAYGDYGERDLKPYEIREDGVYAVEAFRDVCQPGTVYDWTPADEMGWPGSPNPDTAPFLPIPFNAAQLAAAMIDGPGQSIAHALERRLGHPLDDDALNGFPDRMRWMREALTEAYALAADAQSAVGAFDYQAEARAHRLAEQYDEANGQANDREGVFDRKATEDERRARRERASASVLPLKMAADSAKDAISKEWRQWRASMVRQLLRPAPPEPEAPLQTSADEPTQLYAAPGHQQAGEASPVVRVATEKSQEQRQAYRWQQCVDAGLSMPTDTYSHFPRGIRKVAEALKITRQALRQDLNAHRERLFGK